MTPTELSALEMQYDISKLKRFETDAECSERNQKIIRALEKEPKLSKVVGQCIKGCAPFSRCQHILCSHCKREFRLQYVPKICEFLARQKSESCIYAVTLLEPLDASSTKVIDIAKLKNTLYQKMCIRDRPLTVSVPLSSAPLTPPILTVLRKLIHFINLN